MAAYAPAARYLCADSKEFGLDEILEQPESLFYGKNTGILASEFNE
jgi:hypothetical protein